MRGALTLLVGGSVLAACGSTSAPRDDDPPTATPTPVCTGTTANPGYTNGLATVSGQANDAQRGGLDVRRSHDVRLDEGVCHRRTMSRWPTQSVGSGAGVAQIQANTVDFGDSDAFMSDSDIAKAKGPIVQIPLVQAPVVVVYNLPGIASGLKFDGDDARQDLLGRHHDVE